MSRQLAQNANAAGAEVSGDVDEGIAEIILDSLLRHPEGTSDPHGWKLAMMDEAIDRHLGNAHQCSDLGHSKETDLAQ